MSPGCVESLHPQAPYTHTLFPSSVSSRQHLLLELVIALSKYSIYICSLSLSVETRYEHPTPSLLPGFRILPPAVLSMSAHPLPGACWQGRGGVAVVMVGCTSLGGVHGPGADLHYPLPYPLQPGSLCEDECAALRPWVTIPSPQAIWPPWGPPQAGHLCCPSGIPSLPFPLSNEVEATLSGLLSSLRLPQRQETEFWSLF